MPDREKLIELPEEALDYSRMCRDIKRITGGEEENPFKTAVDYLMDKGVTIQKWISVKDRLPNDNGKYLCHIFDSSLNNLSFIAMVHYYRGNFIGQSTCVTNCVTHWMPLPQPPKGE